MAMTYKEFQDLLLNRLGSLGGDDVRGRIKTEAVHVQAQILEGTGAFMPWFLLSGFITSNNLLLGQSVLAEPSDFLQEYEDSHPWYYDSSSLKWVKIQKINFDHSEELDLNTPGPPKYYELTSEGYQFSPVADQDYQLRLRYFQRQTTLTADGDTNKWLTYASDLFLAETGRLVAMYHTHNKTLAKEFGDDVDRARQRLFVLSEARINTNRVSEMGEK